MRERAWGSGIAALTALGLAVPTGGSAAAATIRPAPPACKVSLMASPLPAGATRAIFQGTGASPVAAPHGRLYVVARGQGRSKAGATIEEMSGAGAVVWSMPLPTATVQTASTGTVVAALYADGTRPATSLLFLNEATHRATTVALPSGAYSYSLLGTPRNVVLIATDAVSDPNTAGPGFLEVFRASGRPVTKVTLPDRGGEASVGLLAAGSTTFAEADLAGVMGSTRATSRFVLYAIQGTRVASARLTLPAGDLYFAPVSRTSVLVYGHSATPTRKVDITDLKLHYGPAGTSMVASVAWRTSAVVGGRIQVAGTTAFVGAAPYFPPGFGKKPGVIPAWRMSMGGGTRLGPIGASGLAVYPLFVGPFGLIADVQQSGKPSFVAVFDSRGTLVASEPPNPDVDHSSGGEFTWSGPAGDPVFLSHFLPVGRALAIAGTC